MLTKGQDSARQEVGTEAPPLSTQKILTFITDFVIAALAFLVVLFVTWALHNLGNIFGMGWFRFSWRILELLVISFGTLWCVVFVIAEFTKKSKRQLNIAKRFVEPWRTQPFSLVVCSLIVLAFLYVGISSAEKIRDDCDDTSILACEMLTETGPDFSDPIKDHVTMLTSYSKYLEHKYLPGLILRLLFDYNPEKLLTALSESLSIAKGTQEEVANEIWRAGEDVMLFRLKAPNLLPRGIALHEYRKAPKELLIDIENALEKSKEAARLFDEKPTVENAVHSCESNRKSMLLMFLARKSRQNQFLDDFQVIVEACRNSKIDVANRIQEKDDPRKDFLLLISKSEERRFHILEALKKRDFQKAINLMWYAIDIAYRSRPILLELCTKVLGEQYSKEIVS